MTNRDSSDRRSEKGLEADARKGNEQTRWAMFREEFARQTGGTYSEARVAYEATFADAERRLAVA